MPKVATAHFFSSKNRYVFISPEFFGCTQKAASSTKKGFRSFSVFVRPHKHHFVKISHKKENNKKKLNIHFRDYVNLHVHVSAHTHTYACTGIDTALLL